MLMTVLAVAAPYLASTVTAAVAGAAGSYAVQEVTTRLGRVAYQHCKLLLGRYRSLNHDLEQAMIFANLVVDRSHWGKPSHERSKIFNRLHEVLNHQIKHGEVPAGEESLVAAYMTGDPDEMAPVVASLCSCTETDDVKKYGRDLFFAFSEALKEPRFARAQTAFLRDMLFAIRQEQNLADSDQSVEAEVTAAEHAIANHLKLTLENAQEELNRLRACIGEINNLVEDLRENVFGQQAGIIEIPQATNQSQSPARMLVFAERLVPELYGRADARQWLDDFLASERLISWAVLYGSGGSGKSRLALDLLERTQGTWQGGFVRRVDNLPLFGPSSLANWTPTQDTLFVVDYAQTKSKEVASAIERLHNRVSSLRFRVRFLLLERYYGDDYGYVKPLKTNNAVWGYRHRPETVHGEPTLGHAFGLTPIQPEQFLQAFNAAYLNLTKCCVPFDRRNQLLALFGSPEFKNMLQPLYAGLCAIHAKDHGWDQCDAWTEGEIEEAVLQGEQQVWASNNATQEDVTALVLATMIGGISLEQRAQLERKEWLPDNWDTAVRISKKGGGDAIALIEPLEPDPVGEHMVRLRLRGALYAGDDTYTAMLRTRQAFLHAIEMARGGFNL